MTPQPGTMIKPVKASADTVASSFDTVMASVFSNERTIAAPAISLPATHTFNTRLQMDAIDLLAGIPDCSIPAAFFDPQYRGVLDKLSYGNEGKKRGKARAGLPQMTEDVIAAITEELCRVLIKSGHLFLWMDKFHLCEGFKHWLDGTSLNIVDLVTWHKQRLGMGYRTRRTSEYLVVLQKTPKRAKGVWSVHTIPDIWQEKATNSKNAPHRKPVRLQCELISAVTQPGDIVLDPAAGSFSVLDAANMRGRNFLGGDIHAGLWW